MIKNVILFTLILTLLIPSCTGLIEPDLDEDVVVLLSPPDNHSTDIQAVTFWWDEITGTDEYNLQVVVPDFVSPTQLVIDTNITSNQFTVSLSSNNYQWRVRAENSTSESPYSTHSLEVLESNDLSSQQVVLNTPVENLETNEANQSFNWESIDGASDYRFQIANPDFTDINNVILDITTSSTSFDYVAPEGSLTWRVRGENLNSVSLYTMRQLTIDLTAPSAPSLVSPEDRVTITTMPITLDWAADASSTMDSVFVYQDSLVTGPIIHIETSSTSYDFTSPDPGDYFWRIRSGDTAGNWSDYSTLRKFTYQP